MAAWFQQQLRPHTALSAIDGQTGSSTARRSEESHQYGSRQLAQESSGSHSSSLSAIGSSASSASLSAVGSSGRKGSSGSSGDESGGSMVAMGSVDEGEFREWVCEEEAAGMITFSVKGAGDLCLPRPARRSDLL